MQVSRPTGSPRESAGFSAMIGAPLRSCTVLAGRNCRRIPQRSYLHTLAQEAGEEVPIQAHHTASRASAPWHTGGTRRLASSNTNPRGNRHSTLIGLAVLSVRSATISLVARCGLHASPDRSCGDGSHARTPPQLPAHAEKSDRR